LESDILDQAGREALVKLAEAEQVTPASFRSGPSNVNRGEGVYLLSPDGIHLWDNKTESCITVSWNDIVHINLSTDTLTTRFDDVIRLTDPGERITEFARRADVDGAQPTKSWPWNRAG